MASLRAAFGDSYGWEGGHATFYGGGDASGTMGMTKSLTYFFFALYEIWTHASIHTTHVPNQLS